MEHKLNSKQKSSLRAELKGGGSPSKLAEKYKISLSTVNYHKAQLKEKPDLRTREVRVIKKIKSTENQADMKVILNGITFIIASGAKRVVISESTVEIDY